MGDNDESTQMKKEYGHYTFRKVVFISVSIILVFILFWVSLCVGTRSLSIDQVYSLFWDHVNGIVYPTNSQEWFDDRIVWAFQSRNWCSDSILQQLPRWHLLHV